MLVVAASFWTMALFDVIIGALSGLHSGCANDIPEIEHIYESDVDARGILVDGEVGSAAVVKEKEYAEVIFLPPVLLRPVYTDTV